MYTRNTDIINVVSIFLVSKWGVNMSATTDKRIFFFYRKTRINIVRGGRLENKYTHINPEQFFLTVFENKRITGNGQKNWINTDLFTWEKANRNLFTKITSY